MEAPALKRHYHVLSCSSSHSITVYSKAHIHLTHLPSAACSSVSCRPGGTVPGFTLLGCWRGTIFFAFFIFWYAWELRAFMKPRLSAGPLFLGAGEVTGEPEAFFSSEATDRRAHIQTSGNQQWGWGVAGCQRWTNSTVTYIHVCTCVTVHVNYMQIVYQSHQGPSHDSCHSLALSRGKPTRVNASLKCCITSSIHRHT